MSGFSTVHFIYSMIHHLCNLVSHYGFYNISRLVLRAFKVLDIWIDFFCIVCYIYVAYRNIYIYMWNIYMWKIYAWQKINMISIKEMSPSFTKFDSGSSSSSSGRDLWPSFTDKLITATASLGYLWKGGVCAVGLFSYLDVHRRRRIQVYKLVY